MMNEEDRRLHQRRRGKCVDEAALLTALETDQIKGAALDVTASEPVEEGWRGWGTGMDGKMLMSCHSCDHTEDMSMRSADYFIANLNRYVAGEQELVEYKEYSFAMGEHCKMKKKEKFSPYCKI